MGLVARTDHIVQAALQGTQRQAWAIVLDRQRRVDILHRDMGRHPGRLAGIKAVVDQFF